MTDPLALAFAESFSLRAREATARGDQRIARCLAGLAEDCRAIGVASLTPSVDAAQPAAPPPAAGRDDAAASTALSGAPS